MKFSIVIPVYNVAQYLNECLDSVIAQTFTDWECLCVDDGSIDGSADILDSYASKDSRIKVIHKSNGGVSSARNRGIDEAKGDYILFVDGDDTCVPWMLETLDNVNQDLGWFDIATFGVQRVLRLDEKLPINGIEVKPRLLQDVDSTDVQKAYAFDQVVGSLLVWNGCFRRQLISNIRFEPFRNGEDLLFGTTCFCNAEKVVSIPAVLYRYRMSREGSAVATKNIEHLQSVCNVILRLCEVVEKSYKGLSIVDWIFARKLRSQLFGISYDVITHISGDEQLIVQDIFLVTLEQIVQKYRRFFTKTDYIFVKFAVQWHSWNMIKIGIRGPFVLRVFLQHFYIIRLLKCLIRNGRCP